MFSKHSVDNLWEALERGMAFIDVMQDSALDSIRNDPEYEKLAHEFGG